MEREFVKWLCQRVQRQALVPVGPGDDAAVLRVGDGGELVATTDLLTDGVDFRLGEVAPERIGRKALAVNLSDLAAMAARPLAALVSLALPATGADELARRVTAGILALADEQQVAVVGGDTNTWPGGLVISVTALGMVTPRGPLLRSGARPGDRVLVTGQFGGSILGKQFDFVPRVAEALQLHERYDLHAGIDVSDGLSLDLARLAEASGCGAVIDPARVPIDPAAHRLSGHAEPGRCALDHALADGEDFELVLAASPETAGRMLADLPLAVPLTDIGYFVVDGGLWHLRPDGTLQPCQPAGWEH